MKDESQAVQLARLDERVAGIDRERIKDYTELQRRLEELNHAHRDAI